MKNGKNPDPNVIHPIPGYEKEIYIKPTITNPNIIVEQFKRAFRRLDLHWLPIGIPAPNFSSERVGIFCYNHRIIKLVHKKPLYILEL